MSHCRSADWRETLSRLPENVPFFEWLRDRGSLTARLQRCGVFSIRLLRQTLARPLPDEAALLGLPGHALVWVREVVLYCDGEAVVFAHTILPCRPRGPLTRWLARLGNRSLGALLFAQAGFLRGALGFRRLDARHSLFLPAIDVFGKSARSKPAKLCARRSLFVFGVQSVLVTEVFSPEICRFSPARLRMADKLTIA